MWATLVFRVILILMVSFSTAIHNAPGMSAALKEQLYYWAIVLIGAVWAISRALGVKIKEDETTNDSILPFTDPTEKPPKKP